jgi:hypothetical protein
MWTDPIIEEIHQIRAEHAAQFNYDLPAIVNDLRRREKQSGKKFVSLPPRLLIIDKEKESKVLRTKRRVAKHQLPLREAV